MKKITSTLIAMVLVFVFLGTTNAATMFWDDVLSGGEYTFATDTRTMVIDVQTVYNPYFSGDGSWSSGGTGTTIDWTFTAIFDSSFDDIIDGEWNESWNSNFRIGLFDDG